MVPSTKCAYRAAPCQGESHQVPLGSFTKLRMDFENDRFRIPGTLGFQGHYTQFPAALRPTLSSSSLIRGAPSFRTRRRVRIVHAEARRRRGGAERLGAGRVRSAPFDSSDPLAA